MKSITVCLILITSVTCFILTPQKRSPKAFRKVSYLHANNEEAEVENQNIKGNLFFVDDTWVRMNERDASNPNIDIKDKSEARIDTEISPQLDSSCQTESKTWKVTAPVQFQYRVVEAPRLLDPNNDVLLYGHLSSSEKIEAKSKPQRRLIVIDETVDTLYGEKVRDYFNSRDVTYDVLTLPMVEEEKSVELMLKVCEKMKKFNVDRRNEPVIAIGGGVCLDVVGLASTLFRRKTPYIRVPTTTLSYVDASVGAKSGVNFMDSKNRLGAYVPPIAAFLDPSFIKTEEYRAIASGVSEMAKMALMKSPELFFLLEKYAERLISSKFDYEDFNDEIPARVLRLSIETMLEELAPNLMEKSLDRLLHLSYTVGQELEMHALGTQFELTHGESVAVDMAYSTVLSSVRGHISIVERNRILNMLRQCQVPLYSPLVDRDFIDHAIRERVKQSMGQKLPLPVGIGKGRIFNDVTKEELYTALDIWTGLFSKDSVELAEISQPV